ncbi:MAG: histidine kinase dimerization/phospho-acceptor domain-containing protein [Acidimicrobiales bacterium]
MAHEVRTPLTVAMGYASLLEGADDPIAASASGAILRAAERINRLLRIVEDVRMIDQASWCSNLATSTCGRWWRAWSTSSATWSGSRSRCATATQPVHRSRSPSTRPASSRSSSTSSPTRPSSPSWGRRSRCA